jgi:hypothetical protein
MANVKPSQTTHHTCVGGDQPRLLAGNASSKFVGIA